MDMDSSVAVEAPESEEREEVAKDVCSLTLKHSDSRLIVPAETRSLYARCLMGNYGRWAEEVGSGEVRSTTQTSKLQTPGCDRIHTDLNLD